MPMKANQATRLSHAIGILRDVMAECVCDKHGCASSEDGACTEEDVREKGECEGCGLWWECDDLIDTMEGMKKYS